MPAARRRRATGKKQGSPAWIWLLTGILIGLAMAYYLWSKGYIPQPEVDQSASSERTGQGAVAGDDEVAPASKESKSRYDFFTVLPEMEVIVPEQELDQQRRQEAQAEPGAADQTRYVLQVGSFRDGSDAEEMKARLALLGVTARVQPVTVNDATWHRVRVGPVSGSQQADQMRRRLADNDIESLVMKVQ
jgi:cell division protein FtsN